MTERLLPASSFFLDSNWNRSDLNPLIIVDPVQGPLKRSVNDWWKDNVFIFSCSSYWRQMFFTNAVNNDDIGLDECARQ